MQYIGIDLAWGEGSAEKPANETGVAVLDEHGTITEAGWVRGVDEAQEWLTAIAGPGAVIAIDAPLVVPNATGNRQCESEVARCYGRWQVSANPSNTSRGWQAGVTFTDRLQAAGFTYLDGTRPASATDRSFLEVYPYTTLVGMWELGYDSERPRYKRLVPGLPAAEARAFRAAECDELLRRMAALAVAETPVDLRSHPVTAVLLDEPSPTEQAPYKHREDLLDGVLCAWTAAIWDRTAARTQVLGATAEPDAKGRRPTIVAPARPEQRLAAPRPRDRKRQATTSAPARDDALRTVRELQQLAARLTARLDALERTLSAPPPADRG